MVGMAIGMVLLVCRMVVVVMVSLLLVMHMSGAVHSPAANKVPCSFVAVVRRVSIQVSERVRLLDFGLDEVLTSLQNIL